MEFAVYQPIKETSLYENFLQARQLAIKRQQIKMQQDMAMDEYAASVMRDPNFTKDSPYNPYINQQLQQTLAEARLKYQTGELDASTFKSYVANKIGKINLWVQSADQIMTTVDEGVNYFKTKGADVSSIKNRAARNIFMNPDGSWKTGDQITQMIQDNTYTTVVNDVVGNNPELAFKDMKAFDDWLNTVKTEKENITRQTASTTGGTKTGKKVSSAAGKIGVADYYPMWQQVEKNAAGIPIGVYEKQIPIDQLKMNDAVWLSLVAAVKKQKIEDGKNGVVGAVDKDGNPIFTDNDIVTYATRYANLKRPYNFTEKEEKSNTYITYKTTNNSGGSGETGEDYNIFNATFSGKLPASRYFSGSGDVWTLQEGYRNKLVLGQTPNASGGKIDLYPKSVSINTKDKTLTVVDNKGATVNYKQGSEGYASFMTLLDVNNPWLETSGKGQLSKRSGFKVK
jgi:hypothetical protein